MSNLKKKSPWAWIPTLYFAQGLPYVAVMTISVIMYKRLGISNTDIALYTSWLYLPWVIKPFWSPFVDLIKTKRWWVLTMQFIIGVGLAGIAFTIPTPFFFQLTLAVFWLVAFTSATHDIAADGFYMLALTEHDQSLYVGIRSTFYRISTVAGQGLLVVLAGIIEANSGLEPVTLNVEAGPQYKNEIGLPVFANTERSTDDNMHFVFSSSDIKVGTEVAQGVTQAKIDSIQGLVKELNQENGFIAKENTKHNAGGHTEEDDGLGWFSRFVKDTFGEERESKKGQYINNIAVVAVKLSKKPADGETVILNTNHKKGDVSLALVQGERLEFNANNWDKPAYMVIQIDHKLKTVATSSFEGTSGNIPFAWLVVFCAMSGFFLLICFYHTWSLPKPASDHGAKNLTASNIFREFFETFKTFFQKKQIWVAILFMLLYRLPEAQLVKLINPFLLDPRDLGGLGLTTGEVGLVYGTIGIIGLTLGGIVGGIVAAKGGLKKWLWPMAWSISLTCATFVYLSVVQPEDLLTINICVFVEQFGYGFGFTAYMLYMIYFSEGEHKTAHYAICTAFMALGMMLPGMAAGWLEELIGYKHFFYWVMICCVATIAVCAFIKVDPSFGRKLPEENNKTEE